MSSDYLFFIADNVLLAWSVYIVMMTGAVSFASAAFMSVGCYVAGYLTVKLGWPLYPALFAGAAGAALVSLPIGIPSLRLKGDYFILATFGITISTEVIIENIDAVGASTGFSGMSGVGVPDVLYAVTVVGAILAVIIYTPLQRVLDAIRADEDIAAAIGINVVFVRVVMFALSSAVAGYAGGLYGHYLFFVRPDNFDLSISIYVAFYVILGGVNNFWAPAIGATVLTAIPFYITSLNSWRPAFFGFCILLILWVRPRGLFPSRMRTARAANSVTA